MKRVPPAVAVSQWNAAHPEGTPVTVTLDNGRRIATKTRSRAAVLSNHTAVIWLAGLSGCYLLERVSPREMAEASHESFPGHLWTGRRRGGTPSTGGRRCSSSAGAASPCGPR